MPEKMLRIRWTGEVSDFGQPMPWFGAWLVGDGSREGDWFHSGRGADETVHALPADAIGVRLRFWPSEGLDPEYVDVPLDQVGERNGQLWIDTGALNYDAPGPHSRLEGAEL